MSGKPPERKGSVMEASGGAWVFRDALAHCAVSVAEDGCRLADACEVEATDAQPCVSVFFPGCSFFNFVPNLMIDTYGRLLESGACDGVSFLCCGKLLSFEPDARTRVPAFEERMANALVESGVKRIVAACPNCAAELRRIVAERVPEAGVRVVALPAALEQAGVRADAVAMRRVVGEARVCVHDSCPDRERGEFAEATRALLPQDMLVEAQHNRKTSFCCGALARAAGRPAASAAASLRHAAEAEQVGASAIVVSCVSCAQQLARSQDNMSVHHYLELVHGESVDWRTMPGYMTTRFLFEESHGTRDFVGMDESGRP